jgi:general nucleoside transport system ATP-binding protein
MSVTTSIRVEAKRAPEQASAEQFNAPLSLSFFQVTKRFGATLANDQVSFTVESGGIHAIVGENGAGKSTLTKILYGYYGPDAGAIYLNGEKLKLDSPADARKLGLGMVHQQLALVPSLTGFENVILGDPALPFAFYKKALFKRAQEKARLLGFDLDLSRPVRSLSIAERQKLEIFKLLWRDARVLILDEPTSQLTPLEAEEILSLLASLARAGRIVILITHHIAEVMRFASCVTVLRKGKCVTTTRTDQLDKSELASLMVEGGQILDIRKSAPGARQVVMQLKAVSAAGKKSGKGVREIDLAVSSGEVLGVAGISNSGQNELGLLLAGLLDLDSGEIDFVKASKTARAERVSYIPSEQSHAFAPQLPLWANCFLKAINKTWSHSFGIIKEDLVHKQSAEIIEAYGVSPACAKLPARALSGGNLQRLIIGRELSADTEVVVADNPCAGLDLAASNRVLQALRQACSTRGVVLISPDLEELTATCDRIIVMFNGRIHAELSKEEFDYQKLALLMGG